jgi:putative hemolysin
VTAILIISSAIAIVVSFLCSLAEAILLSFNPLTLNRLQGSHPRAAGAWRRLKKNVARPITAILVLNTVAHTGGATVAGGAFAEIYGEHNIWVFSVIFTIIILLGTEILPKILGVTFRDRLARWAGPILEVVTRLLAPLILLSEFMFRRLTAHAESDQITTADLVTLASLARSGKAIGLEQENIIVNAVRLSHTAITSVMIPLDRIRFLPGDATHESLLALIKECGHTRYPVSSSREAIDIQAYIVTKKAVPSTPGEFTELLSRAKPLRTVESGATLMTGLHAMLQNREHLLVVLDDRKRCAGIVTLEDITGELLGAEIEEFR